jgi:hypothetical protein
LYSLTNGFQRFNPWLVWIVGFFFEIVNAILVLLPKANSLENNIGANPMVPIFAGPNFHSDAPVLFLILA